MPTDLVLLVASVLLAATALVVAVVAVRTGRRRAPAPSPAPARPEQLPRTAVLVPLGDDGRPTGGRGRPVRPAVLAPRHVDGRVVVPPTDHQVVHAAMSRPHVRLAVLAHGVAYALRAESRDRIVALMRREYRRRRRERLAAGRRAVRAANPTANDWTAQPWIGELPARTPTRLEER